MKKESVSLSIAAPPLSPPLTKKEKALLQEAFLFGGLSEEEKGAAIASLSFERHSFPAGEKLVSFGETFPYLGFLVTGALSVRQPGQKQVLYNRLAPGDLFGVACLFSPDEGFPTEVVALKTSSLLFIPEAAIGALLSAYPRVAKNYITFLSGRIRFLNSKLNALAGRSTEEKVAAFLIGGRGRSLSKSALSSALGLGRASLYRALDRFRENGWIREEKGEIILLDEGALTKLVYHTEVE